MIPRVPSFTKVKDRSLSKRSTAIDALSFDVGSFIQQEAVVEGVLHVSAAQAHSCMERFEDLEHLPAPGLPALHTVLTKSSVSFTFGSNPAAFMQPALLHATSGERVLQEAFCLATPPDNPAGDNGPLSQPLSSIGVTRSAASFSHSSSDSSRSFSSAGRVMREAPSPSAGVLRRVPGRTPSNSDLARLAAYASEGQAEQLPECAHAYAAAAGVNVEAVQASEAVARKRRRQLLRLLRNTREARDNLVAQLQSSNAVKVLSSIGSSIAALTSGEDLQVEVCDEEECVLVDFWGVGAAATAGSTDTAGGDHREGSIESAHDCFICAHPCVMRGFAHTDRLSIDRLYSGRHAATGGD